LPSGVKVNGMASRTVKQGPSTVVAVGSSAGVELGSEVMVGVELDSLVAGGVARAARGVSVGRLAGSAWVGSNEPGDPGWHPARDKAAATRIITTVLLSIG
jgi:hypothetical protein